MIIEKVSELIGNTPLLEIPCTVHGLEGVKVFAKLELFNPYGSLKDRIAKNMLDVSVASGRTVIESSSGNTAKALAYMCGVEGIPFHTVTNRIKEPESRMQLQMLGVKIEELPGSSECPDPFDPKDAIQVIRGRVLDASQSWFHTDQYGNPKNIEAHRVSGEEILADLGSVDFFFGFLGTCGSTRGIGSVLKPGGAKVIGVVAKEGEHIPGGRTRSELYETGFYDARFYDAIVDGSAKDAIEGMVRLNREVGLPCGPTSGLAFFSVCSYLKEHPVAPGSVVVFLACDRVESHLDYIRKHQPALFNEPSRGPSWNVALCDLHHVPCVQIGEIPPESIVVDLRSAVSYRMGHLSGSMNIPSFELEEMLGRSDVFPKDRPVVFVCPRGVISTKFAAILVSRGHDAYSLEGGFLGVSQSTS